MSREPREQSFQIIMESDMWRSGRWFTSDEAGELLGKKRGTAATILSDYLDMVDVKRDKADRIIAYRRKIAKVALTQRWDRSFTLNV